MNNCTGKKEIILACLRCKVVSKHEGDVYFDKIADSWGCAACENIYNIDDYDELISSGHAFEEKK